MVCDATLEVFFVLLKGIVHPKNVSYVIVYSATKPVGLEHKRIYFEVQTTFHVLFCVTQGKESQTH